MNREEKQLYFANVWLKKKFGILNLCPRFGKIRVAINILQTMKDDVKVLIAYPDRKIKTSWIDDFQKWGYSNDNITFTTFISLHKHINEKYDLIIIDEIHLLSEAQITVCQYMFMDNKCVLGLTGTLSTWTQRVIERELNLDVVAFYSIKEAINDGIIPDYEINVVTIPLDNTIVNNYKGKLKTEKQRFSNLNWLIEHEQEHNFYIKLKMIEVLQKSIAKKRKTIDLINEFKNDRLLVFCGRTEIADDIGIPSYHSKSSEKHIFEQFVNGDIPHLAVVKIGNTGVTYTPLNKVIINYFDSNCENLTQKINRCMSLEYNNLNKKAIIYLITSNEEIELKWLRKALSMFDNNKINYL